MKEKLKNCINDLRLAEPLTPSVVKNKQINAFFKKIADLDNPDIAIDECNSGDIIYREVCYNDSEEDIYVSVKVIQSQTSDMLIIDADFGKEE